MIDVDSFHIYVMRSLLVHDDKFILVYYQIH